MREITTFLFIIFSLPLFSQKIETAQIRQLKKKLSLQKGSAKVDAMIAISEAYLDGGFFAGAADKRIDSISFYSSTAKSEAQKINYDKGIAHSLVFAGFGKFLKGDYAEAVKDLTHALVTKKLTEKVAGHANSFLGAICFEANTGFTDYNKAVEYLKKAADFFDKCSSKKEQALAYTHLAMTFRAKGNYMSAVDYCSKAVKAGKELINEGSSGKWGDYIYGQALDIITDLYKLGGDYTTAKKYLKQFVAFGQQHNYPGNYKLRWADVYKQEGMYDSALYYLKLEQAKAPGNIVVLRSLGETYLQAKNYSTALQYLQPLVDTFRKRIGKPNAPRATLNVLELLIAEAKAYSQLQNYTKAYAYATEALQLLKQNKIRYSTMQQSELFADAYQLAGNYDSAFVYYKKYRSLQDSIISKQFVFKLYNLNKAAEDERKALELALLQKENQLKEEEIEQQQLLTKQTETVRSLLDKNNKLKDEQLKQSVVLRKQKEADIALLYRDNKLKEQRLKQEAFAKNVMLGSVLALLLIGGFMVRTISLKRKNEKLKRQKAENDLKLKQMEIEKKKAEFQQQVAELEMQALRAQMNPHFIFNCLSSINWLILENNKEAASDYLTRFSRLIRMVLIHSGKSLITLEEEIKMLRLYLDMEKLRFENRFEYSIDVATDLDTASITIPPLLLQPFCENAIWHGLMHKDGNGTLTIKLLEHEDDLYCTITDDGVGRKMAAELNKTPAKKHKSMGLKITADRIALFNDNKGVQTFYEIEDLVDRNGTPAGTRVMIKIKKKHIAEELVDV